LNLKLNTMETNNSQNSGNAPEEGSYERSAQLGTSNDDSSAYTGPSREGGNENPGRTEQGDDQSLSGRDELDTGQSEREGELNASQQEEQPGSPSAAGGNQDMTNGDRNSGFSRENEER
jgi:hypothetical protein